MTLCGAFALQREPLLTALLNGHCGCNADLFWADASLRPCARTVGGLRPFGWHHAQAMSIQSGSGDSPKVSSVHY